MVHAFYDTYRGTSLIRNSAPLGPYMYSRNMPRDLWWSWEGGLFLMSEVLEVQIESQKLAVTPETKKSEGQNPASVSR